MARGMWTGVAQGMQDIQERRRYRQEREDKLSLIAQERADREAERAERRALLNQERQDKLFGLALQFAPQYALSGALTSTGGSGGGKASLGGSADFYEAQLKAFNFSDEAIADLSLKGPYAMQAALETYNAVYDETNPPDETTTQKIADSILIEDVKNVDPAEFAAKMGLDLSALPKDERDLRQAILMGALKRTPQVTSTYKGVAPVKPEDLQKLQTTVADTLKAILESGKSEGAPEQQVEYTAALRELNEGSPARAISLLNDTGELAPAMQQLFDYYPQLKNPQLPLGVFEPIRKALEVSTPTAGVASVPQQAVGYLRANKDTPGVIEAFEEKYGVSAEEYL